MKFKITATPTQYFVISGITVVAGLLFIALSWHEVYPLLKANPAINLYSMGWAQLLISGSMFASGRYLRDIGRVPRKENMK